MHLFRKHIIGIVYNEPLPPGSEFSEASMDVLDQVKAIGRSLKELGYPWVPVPFTRDISRFLQLIKRRKVDMVFNLCEAVDEDARLSGHPAAVLEMLGIPFSGSPSVALSLTTDKFLAKRLMEASGITTPKYVAYSETGPVFNPSGLKYPVIVKPRFEDASIGIDQGSIFRNEKDLEKGLKDFVARFGALLVEEYIDGREFNISLFGYPSPQTLPLAEIVFEDFPEGVYPILAYQAKWDKSSFEYRHTRRRFPQNLPRILQKKIETIAFLCYRLFMLRDYGRIDMRLDARGKVHVLEVNANPCLSVDAGFAATIKKDGMTYSQMVRSFVSFMVLRSGKNDHKASRAPR